jgi:hypothetical protein
MKRTRAADGDDDGSQAEEVQPNLDDEEWLRQAQARADGADRPPPRPQTRVGDSLIGVLMAGSDAGRPAAAAGPAPISVAELRRGRANANPAGSGSVAAMTAAWREEARQTTADTLGFDPDVARHAWKNTGPAELRAAGHPLMLEIDDPEDTEEHDRSVCPLCAYTILPTPPEEIDAGAVAWDDVRQGLSVLLGQCGDTQSRDSAITELLLYYQRRVVEPLAANGAESIPLTRGICLGHIKGVVFNPRAERKRTARDLGMLLAIAKQSSVRYNPITKQRAMDPRMANAFSKLALTRETIMDKIERDDAEARAARRDGEEPMPKKSTLGWRFQKSGIPSHASGPGRGGPSSSTSQFPGTR